MRTYVVEIDRDKTIYGYYKRLNDAKTAIGALINDSATIICLEGPYKFEGFHKYKMKCHNNKFYYLTEEQ